MMKRLFQNEEIIDTKYFNVHQDWETPIPGFFIIASKRKIKSLSEFTEEELAEFTDLIFKIRIGMKEILNIDKVYFFQNEDSKYEFHFWVFPQHPWMEKFGRGISSIGPIKDYAQGNFVTEKNILEIKSAVKKMKEYLNNQSPQKHEE